MDIRTIFVTQDGEKSADSVENAAAQESTDSVEGAAAQESIDSVEGAEVQESTDSVIKFCACFSPTPPKKNKKTLYCCAHLWNQSYS